MCHSSTLSMGEAAEKVGATCRVAPRDPLVTRPPSAPPDVRTHGEGLYVAFNALHPLALTENVPRRIMSNAVFAGPSSQPAS
jgi:hypothetical protein